MQQNLLLTLLSLHFFALITPGPDFILTIKNSLSFGKKMGVATAFGFGMGIGIHVTYSILGVNYLMENAPAVFDVIKWLGALYLIYIGVMTLKGVIKKSETTDVKIKDLPAQSLRTGFTQGFITNILNPKATLFILGIFTSAVPAGTDPKVLWTAGLLMVITTILWFILVSVFFSLKKIRAQYYKSERALNFIFAAFFIFVGTRILLG